ncbi:MAG: transposase [Sulfobacillus benefaciens]|uniref:Transposase n=1 Tax=Sulfobacillus benefaciens TaxID=453960 RepID=A0A2T2XI26_9FIRM|nr:MAG: transposase [Sulfobacillus benefaciens]
MYLTQSNQIKGLDKNEYEALREMCRYAKNLYNVGLYSIRQYFFAEGRYLRYESNYQVVKENENYALLQAGVSQQILKVVDRSFRSFFNLLKKAKKGEYRYQDVRIPHYLEKDGYFPLILSTNAIVIKEGFLHVPMSRRFKQAHPDLGRIKIPFPVRLERKTIKEVRIIPVERARFFAVQFVYEASEAAQPTLSPDKALVIDLGLDNLATCVNSTDGSSFIIDGKYLKSLNHLYNAKMAKLQSLLDQQKLPRSEQMARITVNRNNRVHDYLMKAARYIVNYCLTHKISTIIVGYNPDWKHDANMGKRNNQNFVQIPHGQLRTQLENLCERYGMQYGEQEESYTSKASFLDGDPIPIWNGNHPDVKFSGKRIKRGLYRTKDGRTLNADVNGAANILRKSNHRLISDERVARGLLANPLRVKLT